MADKGELDYDNHPDDEGNHLPPVRAAEGWSWPMASCRKAHYFVDGRSLCGKYGLLRGDLDDNPYIGPNDCRECGRRLNARRKKAGLFQINVP